MAVLLEAALLLRFAPGPVADAMCASRLGDQGGRTFGTLAPGANVTAIVDRAFPVL